MPQPLKTYYFNLSRAIEVHDYIIEKSGGVPGHDANKVTLLESTLDHIQNDLYYPEFLDKITHLLYSINKNHAFIDGNKRSSLALSAYFLELNGYDYCIDVFFQRMEDVVVWVADNRVDKDLLRLIIEDIILKNDSDSVKLALINALQPTEAIK